MATASLSALQLASADGMEARKGGLLNLLTVQQLSTELSRQPASFAPAEHELISEARPLLSRLQELLPKLEQSLKSKQAPSTEVQSDECPMNDTKSQSDGHDALMNPLESSALLELADPSPFVKEFLGIPSEWHEVIQVRNEDTKRLKLYFRCKYEGCTAVFSKSCNLRDHFRKHTSSRPYECELCGKSFT
mmetsp:Transcript_742/g.1119  ORF Transcript_742/g.1119 Transcript_742/m.1119 type:complete len:191 (+) Transcript_742:865-1437(+)|eukprot:CAMPEP_0170460048 /NCGR_PEP_ID=MMETSP0123-20130129/6541_1 /TAXON_ID=182087 /ORGANISM="Favella ehrenbergii, Strain Fehren 1" /LENGTH=190 /DNA_ID=CAMNT_0010724853 /DNA_START=780 /DNA_END=1352 /DNA_ORIENTATION=+